MHGRIVCHLGPIGTQSAVHDARSSRDQCGSSGVEPLRTTAVARPLCGVVEDLGCFVQERGLRFVIVHARVPMVPSGEPAAAIRSQDDRHLEDRFRAVTCHRDDELVFAIPHAVHIARSGSVMGTTSHPPINSSSDVQTYPLRPASHPPGPRPPSPLRFSRCTIRASVLAWESRETLTAQSRTPALIRTKVRAPQLPVHNVFRPRVTQLVSDAARAPLVMVTGAPGAGKTVALQQWLVSGLPDGARVAWLSLDSSDDSPGRFWAYVLLALEGSGAGSFEETRALVSEADRDDAAIVISLLNDMAQRDLTYLVLEDLHHLTDASADRAVGAARRACAETLRIVASSRIDPPLPLSRWRGNGKLGEVRQDALAFNVDEAGELFEAFATGFDAQHIGTVTERTEGWPVALQLAALSSRSASPRTVIDAIGQDGSPIAAYLITEVLDRQPCEIRVLPDRHVDPRHLQRTLVQCRDTAKRRARSPARSPGGQPVRDRAPGPPIPLSPALRRRDPARATRRRS